jgi:hypothetical protein
MKTKKTNILIWGLLSTGSSALVDMLREYDNMNVIPGEFDDYRAPGLVADQLSSHYLKGFQNKIETIYHIKRKVGLFIKVITLSKNSNISKNKFRNRFIEFLIRMRQLSLLKNLNNVLNSEISVQEKIKHANTWISDIGNINNRNREFVVFNQPITPGIDINIWNEVFHPWKMICVYRDPRDQLSEIIKKGALYAPLGAPFMNHGGLLIESIYGRKRENAIKFHLDAIKKRMEWVDHLKETLEENNILLIDFEGLINNYDHYKKIIEQFIGNKAQHHINPKLFFNPTKAKKNIGIYREYLNQSDLDSMFELKNWYNKMSGKADS